MQKFLVGILLFLFACKPKNSQTTEEATIDTPSQVKTEQKKRESKCNQFLDQKVYEYLPSSDIPEHLFTLIFTCGEQGLTGKILGPNPMGDQGQWFFRANLENLKVDSLNHIQFDFTQGYLYPDLITLENYLETLTPDEAVMSNERFFYKGQMVGDSIVLTCSSNNDECYEQRMVFRKKH